MDFFLNREAHQKIDHFFKPNVERQNKKINSQNNKMNSNTNSKKIKKTCTCSTCGKSGHNASNKKFHSDYEFTGVSVPAKKKDAVNESANPTAPTHECVICLNSVKSYQIAIKCKTCKNIMCFQCCCEYSLANPQFKCEGDKTEYCVDISMPCAMCRTINTFCV